MGRVRYFDFSSLKGETLDGRYRVNGLLGEGGQAGVLRAWDEREGRAVAVKVMRPDTPGAASRRKRFDREAFAMTQLDHPNCVKVYDTGVDEARQLQYMVMEMVEGQPLDIFIAFPMTERQVIQIGRGIALGLCEAHHHGIFHRDLKPENVVLRPSGRRADHRAILIDFGIAKFAEGYQMTMLTGSEMVLGTVQYMSPEQAEGLPLDERTDVYSLGVVMYELLSGLPPFHGKPIHVLQAHLSERVPKLKAKSSAHITPRLESVLTTCLAKTREQRYRDGEGVAAALNSIWTQMATEADLSPVLSMACDPHVGLLALGFNNGDLEVRELDTGKRVSRTRSHEAPVCGVAFGEGGEVVVSADTTGVLHAWTRSDPSRWAPVQCQDQAVTSMAASRTASFYAVGSLDGRVRVMAWDDDEPVAEFRSHRTKVNRLLFDPTGQLLLSAGEDGAVLVWDLGGLEVENRFAIEGKAATSLAFEPTNGIVAMGSDTGRITIGYLDGSAREYTFFAHAAAVTGLAFVFEEGLLEIVSAGLDGEIRQWRVHDGRPRPFAGLHPSGVRAICIDPSGAILAANDSQVIRWGAAFRDPALGVPESYLSPRHPGGWVAT